MLENAILFEIVLWDERSRSSLFEKSDLYSKVAHTLQTETFDHT